jgi:hypothetical protein
MTLRTTQKQVTFRRPFSLRGVDGVQPPGTYTVETEEELIEGLSFPAYRRIATSMFLPFRAGGTVSGQFALIDPPDLEAAQERDALVS